MNFFTEIDKMYVILRCNGTYRQCKLFSSPSGKIFAKWGTGYVTVMTNYRTSKVGVFINVFCSQGLFNDNLGRIFITNATGRERFFPEGNGDIEAKIKTGE